MKKKLSKSIATVHDEAYILVGIRKGSSEALHILYRDYLPMITNMVISNNGSEEEAKDVFQEATMVLYDKLQDENFVLSSKLKTYLYAVCRRLWLKQLNRQERSYGDITDYEGQIQIEDDLKIYERENIAFEKMEEALTGLGEPCRTIIHDFYILNKSMQDICEKFGYTNSDNAKNQKYKCLQRLKKLFFKANQ